MSFQLSYPTIQLSNYKDGEVVWVKWGSLWWPAEVWDRSRVPDEVFSSLRKPVTVFVRFFQEETFEFVRNLGHIDKYNCERKMEYIKKGMDKFKSNKKIMTNFPADVIKAEELTKGNTNILKSFESSAKTKPVAATPVKSSITTISTFKPKFETAIVDTVFVPSKKQSGPYNSTEKVQVTSSLSTKNDIKKFTCTMCHFSTDRMNLLMFHIKNHSSSFVSKVHDSSLSTNKKSSSKSPVKKPNISEDTIADDVRKIKESMKDEGNKQAGKKNIESKAPVTGTKVRGRSSKKKEKLKPIFVENQLKKQTLFEVDLSTPVNTLKNELLADWSDDDDDQNMTTSTLEVSPTEDKTGDGKSSKSIRNIPKKQRVNEVYVIKSESRINDEDDGISIEKIDVTRETSSRVKNRLKQQLQLKSEEPKQITETYLDTKDVSGDHQILATASELLNETEVPTVNDADNQSSTFHKNLSKNDLEKQRNLPPKERNKRIFRATESSSPSNNGVSKDDNDTSFMSELMLPHKKKQSSRFLSNEKLRTSTISSTIKESPSQINWTSDYETRNPLNNQAVHGGIAVEASMPIALKAIVKNSPLREDDSNLSSSEMPSRRTQKRKNSVDFQPNKDEPKLKKRHSINDKSIVIDNTVETITSETEMIANPQEVVIYSSQKDLSETNKSKTNKSSKNALKFPAETLVGLKKQGLVAVGSDKLNKLTEKGKQIYEDIQMKEKLEMTAAANIVEDEFEKREKNETTNTTFCNMEYKSSQSLDTSTMMSTPKDSQNSSKKSIDSQSSTSNLPEIENLETKVKFNYDYAVKQESIESKNEEEKAPRNEQCVKIFPKIATIKNDSLKESVEVTALQDLKETEEMTDESRNNNTDDAITEEKTSREIFCPLSTVHQQQLQDDDIDSTPIENGKETENESSEDTNGGAGLIALQAESFGGPANCFYLCRNIDDRYVPVDNQVLILNAQNALVPYEGDINADDVNSSSDAINENIAALPQLSPNSNIIISTPNGQKIELNNSAIIALQEQADENGIASIDYAGEQIELNIHGILEALSVNQEGVENDFTNSLLVESEAAVACAAAHTIDSEMPVEVHNSATLVVSETLSKPIMSTTVAPEISMTVKPGLADAVISSKTLNIEDSLASIGVVQTQRAHVPKSLELPITVTNSTIAETVNYMKFASAAAVGNDDTVDAISDKKCVVQKSATDGRTASE